MKSRLVDHRYRSKKQSKLSLDFFVRPWLRHPQITSLHPIASLHQKYFKPKKFQDYFNIFPTLRFKKVSSCLGQFQARDCYNHFRQITTVITVQQACTTQKARRANLSR